MCILMYMHSGYTNVMENQLEILDYILSAVVIINTEGKIVFVNDPFLELFQYKKEEILDKKIGTIIPSKYDELYQRVFRIYKNRGNGKSIDIKKDDMSGLRSDGEEIPIMFRLSQVECEEKKFFLFSIDDLSALVDKINSQSLDLIRLSKELLSYNMELDKKVDKQVGEIKKINDEIIDSIQYSKKIQQTILKNSDKRIDRFISNFIIYKPKDIVSGDFYWSYKTWSGDMYIAVGDCTGHGVPGAFLTMLANSLLNEIVITKRFRDTAKILNQLRYNVISLLSHREKDGVKDGLDITLIKIAKGKKEIEYAGANNPLFLFRNDEIEMIRTDSFSIGYETEVIEKFKKHTIKLNKGDRIYLCSDGYQDQFGGEKDKKLKRGGFKRVLKESSTLTVNKQKQYLYDFIVNWKGDKEQVDDITLMGLLF